MRSTVLFLLLLFAAAVPARAWTMGDDGLHKEAWFSLTFRDVSDDIRQARESGKRLVLDFEQRGCIYCKKMHEQILSDPRVSDYIKANFMVVQYNMFGDEEVTDLDGKQLSEKTAARKWGLLFTPTLLFMPDHVPAQAGNGCSGCGGGHAGRFREGNVSRHVPLGEAEGLRHRRALPEVSCPDACGARARSEGSFGLGENGAGQRMQ